MYYICNMRSGQALVLVMMVLSVALTVGLSIAARSVNEVRVTSAQEESARALEAAETGLEKALGGTLQGNQVNLSGSGATFVILPTPTSGAKLSEFVIPYQLVEGQVATVDLTNYTNSTAAEKDKFRYCWGSNTSTDNPALAVDMYYTEGSQVFIGKAVFDPLNRITSSDSGPWNPVQCPPGFKYSIKVPASLFIGSKNFGTIQLKMLRLKVLFNGSSPEPVAVVVAGNGDFGRQGDEYVSVGSVGTSTQKLRGVELNYDLPTVFDNAVFSGTSLSK